MIDIQVVLNDWFISEIAHLNQRFIKEATEQWDMIGAGDFSVYMQTYLQLKWIDFSVRN